MEMGFGWLRLSPDAFWSMTLRELAAGADGYAAAHGWGQGKSEMYDELLDMLEGATDSFSIRKKKPKPKPSGPQRG